MTVPLLFIACKSHYRLTKVERTRVLVDKRYDAHPDAEAAAFLAPFKNQVDSIMSPVVGRVDHYMSARKPESEESNLLADILVWGGQAFGEKPDFGGIGVEVIQTTPESFDKTLRADAQRYDKIIRDLGITSE